MTTPQAPKARRAPTPPGYAMGLAGIVTALSTWLVWLSADGETRTGRGVVAGGSSTFKDDPASGNIVLVLGVLVAFCGALYLFDKAPKAMAIVGTVLATLALGANALIYAVNVGDGISAGFGLYLAIIASLAALVASVWAIVALRKSRNSQATNAPHIG